MDSTRALAFFFPTPECVSLVKIHSENRQEIDENVNLLANCALLSQVTQCFGCNALQGLPFCFNFAKNQ